MAWGAVFSNPQRRMWVNGWSWKIENGISMARLERLSSCHCPRTSNLQIFEFWLQCCFNNADSNTGAAGCPD